MNVSAFTKVQTAALIAGVVSLILSFVSKFVTASLDSELGGIKFDAGISAWNGFGSLGVLLIVVATAIVALKVMSPEVLPGSVPWSVVVFAASALGTVVLILRALTYGDGGVSALGVDVNVGPGWSGYLMFVTTIAMTALAFADLRASGEKFQDLAPKSDDAKSDDPKSDDPTPPDQISPQG